MPTCPDSIKHLVEQFARHRDEYHTGRYNETQLRRDYLDPFFKALGWDIDNEKGFAEAYREVIHEDAIKIGGTTKAPDYSFRIGGQRKFFVEAKKPSVNLKNDPAPALQVRRYAWTAKLPVSVLTDFEEFALYDCRKPPKANDKAHTARLDYFTFDQIPEKWDEISGLLSPQAIQQGAFDKYASKRRTRGTTDVDDVFLDQLESWRQDLAKHLIRENQNLTQRQLNHAVQLIIDRIVFLRICEDRGIEQAGTLLALTNGSAVYDRLQERFRAADDKYNSGLFHFQPESGREDPDTVTPGLTVGDRPLKAILKNLYPPESPYEFSVLPADILGQVYERFLGKVITLSSTGKTATVEEKPEVRKAGGVYYTPRYIVDYIVKQTVGELLKERKIEPKGRGKNKLPAMNKPLTVLDPACGSGSFLLGAFDHLLNWHLDYYVKNDPETWAKLPHPPIAIRARKDAEQEQSSLDFTNPGDWKLTTTEKKRILLEHLYGVDIDAQAVEVTKLSLLLKVLEGENEETVQRSLFAKERALPDLSNNIKCGNSLIGTDFYNNQQMGMFSEDDFYRINAFDWETQFATIMQSGGFDAVIGNPPYRKERDHKELMDEIALTSWGKKHKSARMDLWYYFVHRALDVIGTNGLLSFIVNSYWTSSSGAKKLIDRLETIEVCEFFSLTDLEVFRDVSGLHMMFKLRNAKPKKDILIKIAEKNDSRDAEPYVKEVVDILKYSKSHKHIFHNSIVDLEPHDDGRAIASNTSD